MWTPPHQAIPTSSAKPSRERQAVIRLGFETVDNEEISGCLRCPSSKPWPQPHLSRAALRAAQPRFDSVNLPRPAPLVTQGHDLQWIEHRHSSAISTIGPERVSVPTEVADVTEPLATHGLRLNDHTRALAAVTSAATAKTIIESNTSILASHHAKAHMFYNCSV